MAIRWDKFTLKAQEAVQRANELASEHGNPEVLPLHLLAALLEDKEGIVSNLYLKQLPLGPMQNFVYLIGDRSTRQAVVVDPAWDIDAILNTLADDDMRLEGTSPLHRDVPIARLANDGHVGLGIDEHGETFAQHRVIVRHENSQGTVHATSLDRRRHFRRGNRPRARWRG